MTTQETIERLEDLKACEESVEWAKDQKDFEAIINNCQRGDWLFWLGGRILTSREIAIPKAEISETVLHIFEEQYPDDDRPREAIEAAKQYGRGEIDAASAAHAAAADAARASAAHAAAADAAAADAARKESERKSAYVFRTHFSVEYLEEKLIEATDQ